MVFTNAKVYTVNEAQDWSEAVAVAGNKIIHVVDSAYAADYQGADLGSNGEYQQCEQQGIEDVHQQYRNQDGEKFRPFPLGGFSDLVGAAIGDFRDNGQVVGNIDLQHVVAAEF